MGQADRGEQPGERSGRVPARRPGRLPAPPRVGRSLARDEEAAGSGLEGTRPAARWREKEGSGRQRRAQEAPSAGDDADRTAPYPPLAGGASAAPFAPRARPFGWKDPDPAAHRAGRRPALRLLPAGVLCRVVPAGVEPRAAEGSGERVDGVRHGEPPLGGWTGAAGCAVCGHVPRHRALTMKAPPAPGLEIVAPCRAGVRPQRRGPPRADGRRARCRSPGTRRGAGTRPPARHPRGPPERGPGRPSTPAYEASLPHTCGLDPRPPPQCRRSRGGRRDGGGAGRPTGPHPHRLPKSSKSPCGRGRSLHPHPTAPGPPPARPPAVPRWKRPQPGPTAGGTRPFARLHGSIARSESDISP